MGLSEMTSEEVWEWAQGTFDLYGSASFKLPDGSLETRQVLRVREIKGIMTARVRAGDMLRDIATEADRPGRAPTGANLLSGTVHIYPNQGEFTSEPAETFEYRRSG